MSNNVDERIVGMQFDNKQFEANAKTTMSTMDKLKASLTFDGAKKGINDLSDAASNLKLGDKLGDGVEGLMGKFSALQAVAFGALANIGAKAVDMGLQMAKSLTIDPIKAGFDEYELKLGSIQTILANTAKYGTKLPEVTAALDELNTYADKTIYNFGDMTRNIGLFTNAGIGIQDATAMIKGFSNEAASSGASAEGAAGAAYQLSQALSRGKITLQDWNSLANAGMGSANMKDGLVQIAAAMGTFNDNTTTAAAAQADFNGTLEKGWLSSDVMSTYLRIQAGELDATAMATLGLSDTQIAAFQAQQKVAEDAATKVRSFTGLVGTLREAVGSGWTETFEIIVGDFDEATNLWTAVNDKLGGVIGAMGQARNDMLNGWDKLGGRQDLLDIGANLYNSLANVIRPVQQAFAKIFPPDGGSALKAFTGGLKIVTGVIENITSGLEKLQPVFEVIFGLFKIAFSVVSGVLGVFVNMFALFGGAGTGSILGVVGGFAALVAKVVEFINQGQYIAKFFDGIKAAQTAVLGPLLDFFNRLKDAVMAFVKTGDKESFIANLKDSFQAFAPLIDLVSSKLQIVSGWIQDLGAYFGVLGSKGNSALSTIGALLQTAAEYVQDFATGFAGLKSMIIDGDFVGSEKTWGWMEDSKPVAMLFDIRDALMGVKDQAQGIDEAFTGVSGKFAAIGGQGGEQVVSVWTRIGDAFKAVVKFLQPAITAVGNFFSWLGSTVKRIIDDLSGQDMLALVNTGLFMAAYLSVKKFFDNFAGLFSSASDTFEKIGGIFDGLTKHLEAMTNNVKSDTLMKLAIALGVLVASIWVLSTIDTGALAASTLAMGLLFKMLTNSMDSIMESVDGLDTGKILAAGVTMVLLGAAILLISAALKVFASMDLGELAKSVVTLGVVLKLLSMALDAMPEKDLVKSAVTLGILAGALLLFSLAILAFSAMDVGTVAEGLAYLAGTLLVLNTVMKTMPEKQMLKNAIALGIVAASLQLVALAILTFSAMDVGTVVKGLVIIGASLLILAIGMAAMSEALPGAAATLVVAAALMVLALALKTIGSLSWEDIGKGLLVIVVSIALFAGAALLLTPILPILAAFAIVLLALGIAMGLAGAGMFLFASAFALLAVSGIAGAAGFTVAMTAILELLPLFAQQLGLAVKAFAVVISEAGPEIVAALTTLLLSLIQAIVNVVPPFIAACVVVLMAFLQAVQIVGPEYIKTIITLIEALLVAIIAFVPRMVNAALIIMTGFLTGLRNNLTKLIAAGTDLIISFIQGITNASLKITNAALDAVITFVNGLATAIRSHSAELNAAGRNLASAIVDGLTGGLGSMVGRVTEKARALVANIPSAIKKVLGIASPSKVTTKLGEFTGWGLVNGLINMAKTVYKAAMGTGEQAVDGLNEGIQNAKNASNFDVNLNPVIKPVLDLTDVRAGAAQMDAILAPSTVSVGTSTNSAQSIAASQQEASASMDANGLPEGATFLEYNQYNSSPEAISTAEVYRQTKNQLSTIKEGLPG